MKMKQLFKLQLLPAPQQQIPLAAATCFNSESSAEGQM